MTLCACGSSRSYSQCCEPFHSGQQTPSTPEKLMRSRYTAYSLNKTEYIHQTWHASTRPSLLELQASHDEKWIRLTVKDSSRSLEEQKAWVHFVAYSKQHERLYALEEKSRFVFEENRWFYKDGQCQTFQVKIGRNEPCICLSGKKYKRCCG